MLILEQLKQPVLCYTFKVQSNNRRPILVPFTVSDDTSLPRLAGVVRSDCEGGHFACARESLVNIEFQMLRSELECLCYVLCYIDAYGSSYEQTQNDIVTVDKGISECSFL